MGIDWGEWYIVNPDIMNHKVKKKKMHNAANSQKSYMCSTPPAFYTVPNELGGLIASWSFVKWLHFDNLVVINFGNLVVQSVAIEDCVPPLLYWYLIPNVTCTGSGQNRIESGLPKKRVLKFPVSLMAHLNAMHSIADWVPGYVCNSIQISLLSVLELKLQLFYIYHQSCYCSIFLSNHVY